ncbi:hypothetical protein TRFO_08010 [Tritrichomonas foetus]|uniref:TAF6 C-terminal HEAT repeat domain-containing protein n=1 Tax=Tritrichomonas foetus TaxID=1144522 RepID=A0A1J4JMP1_9EUKA|nr:hypothetical protein TRFO_08010 [Tritrichomonas foetus]|eukprot:OHT00339.1 hypothetical protein TRFO_08010 [Tritrichomonas foetus]
MSESSRVAVQAIADQLGIPVSRTVINILAQDTEFRIKQIITPAAILHKKTHTPKLTVQQINMVLASQRLPPILGYSSTSSYKIKTLITEDNDELCVVSDPEVQLADVAKNIIKPAPRPIPFNFQWMMVDGIPIERRNPRSRGTKPTIEKGPFSQNESINTINSLNPIYSINSINLMRTFSDMGEQQITNKDVISPDLQHYFEHAVELFDSGDRNQQIPVFEALSTDAGIQPLLPLFLQFLSFRITVGIQDLKNIEKVCLYSLALIENPSLPIPFYAHGFLRVLMTAALRFDSNFEYPNGEFDNDEFLKRFDEQVQYEINVRQIASKSLKRLCKRCVSGFPNIKTVVINAMIQTLFNANSTLAAHCGAILSILKFGPETVAKITPHIPLYVNAIKREIELDNSSNFPFARAALVLVSGILEDALKSQTQPMMRFQVAKTEVDSLLLRIPKE